MAAIILIRWCLHKAEKGLCFMDSLDQPPTVQKSHRGLFVFPAAGACLVFSSLVFAPYTLPVSDGSGTERTPPPVRSGDRRAKVTVPPGLFLMGADRGQPDERPLSTVWVSGFSIDRYEVTVGRYRGCVAAGDCKSAGISAGGPSDRMPVTGVSYFDAEAFCRFAGSRLPTEAEWEKGARGSNGRRFPWGDDAECLMANYGNYLGQGPCAGVNPGRPLPPGSRGLGTSPHGLEDMAGNVWEWVRPVPGKGREARKGYAVVKGGSFASVFLLPRSANRIELPRSYRDWDIGFRCARDLASGN